MATPDQLQYYEYLCEQACIEPEDDYEDVSDEHMSAKIRELLSTINKGE